MIDTSLSEMSDSGFVEKVLKKYEQENKMFYRVRKPYHLN